MVCKMASTSFTSTTSGDITNGDVYTLIADCKKNKTFCTKNVANLLRNKFSVIGDSKAADITLFNKAKSIHGKVTQLNSNRSFSKKADFLNQTFRIPQQASFHRVETPKEICLSREKKNLKRSLDEALRDNDDLLAVVQYLEAQHEKLIGELQLVTTQMFDIMDI
ncbi:uncharacterized protein LOC144453487 [Glandiceps talaboti]